LRELRAAGLVANLRSLLDVAVASGNLDASRLLCAAGAEIYPGLAGVALELGSVELCRWVGVRATWPAVWRAAANGNYDVCRWLVAGAKEGVPPEFFEDHTFFAVDLLGVACSRGVADLEWVCATFGMQRAVETHLSQLMDIAITGGRLDVCRWLVGRAGAVHAGVVAEWVACAAEAGCLHICRWLASAFPVRANLHLLYAAVAGGHVRVCQWVVAEFGVTPTEWDYENAAVRGRLDVCRWLRAAYGLAPRCLDATAHTSALNGHAHVCRWLYAAHAVAPYFHTCGNTGARDLLRVALARAPVNARVCWWLCAAHAYTAAEMEKAVALCAGGPPANLQVALALYARANRVAPV